MCAHAFVKAHACMHVIVNFCGLMNIMYKQSFFITYPQVNVRYPHSLYHLTFFQGHATVRSVYSVFPFTVIIK